MLLESELQPRSAAGEPQVTIEMGGPNIVIRSSADLDHAYTASLVSAVNAATEADVDVVIDPATKRCDDAFASYRHPRSGDCTDHATCRPVAATAIANGIVRFMAEGTVWTLDVAHGRLCRSDQAIDVRFLGDAAWSPVVAVCVSPTRLVALTHTGARLSERRAHRAVDQASSPGSMSAA